MRGRKKHKYYQQTSPLLTGFLWPVGLVPRSKTVVEFNEVTDDAVPKVDAMGGFISLLSFRFVVVDNPE
jgi:hypothetical protein